MSFSIAALDVLGGLCLALGSLLLVMGRNPLPFGRRPWSPVGARFDGAAMAVLGLVLLVLSTGTGGPGVPIVGGLVYATLTLIALLADLWTRRDRVPWLHPHHGLRRK